VETLTGDANSALAATLRVDVTPKLITGLRFTVMLGRSYMTGTKNDKRARQVIMEIVGVSEHATTLGFSVPAATAMRWNAEFGRPERPVEAAWVELSSPKRLSEVVDQARALGLAVDDSQRMIAAALDGVLAMLLLVAGLLLGLAAMIIGQTFFTRVALRRGEYALYRALGARRSTLIAVVLSEAAGVGLVCGLLGLSIGNLVGGWLEAKALLVAAELPFAPDALLSDSGFASLIGLSVAVGFAILGALRPAVGAASADPAVALGL
ncbi:MAG: ABC transporter permease, partial [Myxococcota bacterium]|nr:ABC transporter permease [Myxococcota bacterium]